MSGDDRVGSDRRGRNAEIGRDPLSGHENPEGRRRRPAIPILLLGGLAVALVVRAVEPPLVDVVAESLRRRFETAAAEAGELLIDDAPLYDAVALSDFYQRRVYRPAWVRIGTSPALVGDLIRAIEQADRHGLDPDDYHFGALLDLERRASAASAAGEDRPERLADLELLASDAFLAYAAHLHAGRVDPQSLAPEWRSSARDRALPAVLDEALTRGDIRASLEGLAPSAPGYARLREALAHHRALAARGGWGSVTDGPKLELGATGERVLQLRRRLGASGDLDSGSEDLASTAFDLTLQRAVETFQRRHGLEVDGVVGPVTLHELNVGAADRARQIALNLERWRWLARDLGRRHVLVNVPAFELRVIEDEREVLRMAAVVGKPYRSTPVFSALMTYLVVSPYWQVPRGIAVRDILPAVKEDPSYLAERGFRVFEGYGGDEREIDAGEVDWKSLDAQRFTYRFRQEPGNKNMLGRIKFMFPNRYNVYVHDTPLRELFLPARRDFSSGCIRIERPFELAEYVLRGDGRWTLDRLAAAATVDAETTIPLPEPIPVHVLYWTSWVDSETEFRPDIYGRDAALAEALR